MAKKVEKETEDILTGEKLSEKDNKKSKAKEDKIKAKKEKAEAKKSELAAQIKDVKAQLEDETDEKAKKKLRAKRDNLIAQRDGITKSKDGMTIPLAPNTKKAIKACVAIVIVLALLCAYIATGGVKHGLMSNLGVPQTVLTGVTITDGDGKKHSVKVSTYNYYFALQYNNLRSTQSQYEQYGLDLAGSGMDVDFDKKFSKQTTTNHDGDTITWAEYMEEEVLESIQNTYTYYYEALKANDGKEPEIKESQQKELDETLDEYKETAEGYGYTTSGYLTAAMGKGVNEKVFRREAKISYIAQNYQTDYQKELSNKAYSDEDYENYKKDNKDDLVSVDIRMFECDTEDDAKAFAKALRSDASNFASLASKYSEDEAEKKANKNDVETTYKEITRPTLKSMGVAIATAEEKESEGEDGETETTESYPGLDWLFSSDRKKGDITQYSTTVVYVLKAARLSDTKTVNVRHILIKPFDENAEESEDGETTEVTASEATDEQWANAEKKAKDILKQYKDGEKTADAFGELAKDNSEDSNAEDGGLYENVTPNQMVPTFNAWIFDSSRKTGDVGIVKTEFGYHVMYFEGQGDLPVWKYTAQQALASDDSTDTIDKLEKSYSIKKNWLGALFFETDTDIDN